MAKFKSVQSQVDFPEIEQKLLDFWYQEGIVEKYLNRNQNSEQKFSFLDGPITANNPMGVHHAWGRTYKDLWQRFFNMRGYKQRFQNGFDEQGLWVEVEVEKELGLKNKKDIENLVPGDEHSSSSSKFKSLEQFINLCKERVAKFSAIQTDQSKRLGYFMDWNNSYHTSSDTNNYSIWNFLKVVNEKGWLYKGHDSVPWCPRCGTAISQHEILTEEYKEITHTSIYFKLPIKNRENEYFLIWTTTPWTIPANVAVAVDASAEYVSVLSGDQKLWVMGKALPHLKEQGIFSNDVEIGSTVLGSELVDSEYTGPFDQLEAVKTALGEYEHRTVATDPVILPITAEEGTGIVHLAPGAGAEDFALSKKENLPVIAPIDEGALYVAGFGELTGKHVQKVVQEIVDTLLSNDFLFKTQEYKHRYPTCWRCKTELVWRVVDEWYIAMDRPDSSDKTYREQMIEVTKQIDWIPKWGLERELDWLNNMHDWLISKKRYWGLALPIWECAKCENFDVLGGKDQLKQQAVEGWNEFEGHSPHRPWIDRVKIKCSKCGEVSSRIADVGNPWLDAGIVPFSTLPEGWFPADFITESFPGQFKNWFYSLIAMSTALANSNSFKSVLGFALLRDEKGEEMHKSKGNSIEFNEAANKIGADTMRWMYVTHNPEINLNFGYNVASDIRRRFFLILWNSYKFFIDYASTSNWDCDNTPADIKDKLTVLDRWILARLTQLVLLVNKKLESYDAVTASRAIEEFVVNDFSTWYIRRSRDRVGKEANSDQRAACLSVMYGVLVTLTKLLAPFTPFMAEEIFKNLTGEESVHLQDYPLGDKSLLDEKLIQEMIQLRKIAEMGNAKRKDTGIKLRQPLAKVIYETKEPLSKEFEQLLGEELNIKQVEYKSSSSLEVNLELDTNITPKLKAEGEARDLIRQIQQLRKDQNLTLADKTKVETPSWPKDFEEQILKSTASESIVAGPELKIVKI